VNEEDDMAQQSTVDPTYVMGRSEAEAQRLMVQSRLLDRITRSFLTDAGIAPGMTVLDVGSGAGDVAFATADLVGPHGRVIGVDLNPAILETARARAAAEGRDNVEFIAGDCRSAGLPDGVDAAIGRFVLFYTSDIVETLRAVAARVKPGGVVAFAEFDFNSILGYLQTVPSGVNRTTWERYIGAFASAGIPMTMVAPLYRAFLEAGLNAPKMSLQTILCGADDVDGFAWFAATARSLIPILEQYGLVTAEILDCDTLAARAC
jgi:ubiquinone/menaquinone biosynthesis C-methylase UbiE